MRNLKKILALVLALVMSLSLMATASATDFKDDSEITSDYRTAIEVLEGLKVFKGYAEDNTFRPKGDITRAEVATIIYRIATGDAEDKQASIYTDMTTSFADLNQAQWARGYVNYCHNAQIIKGESATKFNPNGKISGYATLAMILRTMGYGKNGEFEGKGWEYQTAAKAKEIGLIDNVMEAQLGSSAPRELVAEILFRALLTEMVDYTVLNGYVPNGKTLGYEKFRLESLEGVVVANEFANLYGDFVLGKDKTNLEVAENDVRKLDVPSAITDIGESRYAYVTGSRVLALGDTGNNVVTGTDGAACDISTTAKFSATAEMAQSSSTEFYRNFGRVGYYTSDFRIEYVIRLPLTVAEAAVYETDNDGKLGNQGDPVRYKDNSLYYKNGAQAYWYYYDKVIKAGDPITQTDMDNIKTIFVESNGLNLVGDGIDYDNTTDNWYTGKVFVATQTKKDISDEISYNQFVDTYINDEAYDNNWNTSKNGDWVKFVDNNNDGICDYAFKTESWLDEATSTYTTASGDTVLMFNEFNDADDTVRYMDGDVSVGDVVVAAWIDHQILVEHAKDVTKTVNKYDWKNDKITTTDGDEYGQSGIGNKTGMQELLATMDEKTEYVIYFDHFGYVRAYELPGGTKYALVTELYFKNNNNGNLVQNWPMVVELWDGENGKNEYSVSSSTQLRAVTSSPWLEVGSIANRGSYYNWLQPAIPHLGVTRTGFGPVRTNPSGVPLASIDTTKQDTFWKANYQLINKINSLNDSEEFDYDTQKYYDDAAAPTRAVDNTITTSFTNVAVVNITGDSAVVNGAAQLKLDSRGNIMAWNDVGNDGIYTGNGAERPAYAVDYVQLDRTKDVTAKQVRYPLGGDSTYKAQNNYYVNATHKTQYYIVYNGNVLYFEDYEKMPALTNEVNYIHAAYAVARDTSADDSKTPYWVADVIVYEVETYSNLEKMSVSLAYYNPERNTGSVQLLNTLNSKYGPMMNLTPAGIDWNADKWQWGPTWGYGAYGFYRLSNEEKVSDTEMTAQKIEEIKYPDFNKNGIFAGTITRTVRVESDGTYIDINTDPTKTQLDENGNTVLATTVSVKVTGGVYSITKDQVLGSSWDYNKATLLRCDDSVNSQVKPGDRVIWVGENKAAIANSSSYIVDLGNDVTTPTWDNNSALRTNTALFLLNRRWLNGIAFGNVINVGPNVSTSDGLWQRIMAEQALTPAVIYKTITVTATGLPNEYKSLFPQEIKFPYDNTNILTYAMTDGAFVVPGYKVTTITDTTAASAAAKPTVSSPNTFAVPANSKNDMSVELTYAVATPELTPSFTLTGSPTVTITDPANLAATKTATDGTAEAYVYNTEWKITVPMSATNSYTAAATKTGGGTLSAEAAKITRTVNADGSTTFSGKMLDNITVTITEQATPAIALALIGGTGTDAPAKVQYKINGTLQTGYISDGDTVHSVIPTDKVVFVDDDVDETFFMALGATPALCTSVEPIKTSTEYLASDLGTATKVTFYEPIKVTYVNSVSPATGSMNVSAGLIAGQKDCPFSGADGSIRTTVWVPYGQKVTATLATTSENAIVNFAVVSGTAGAATSQTTAPATTVTSAAGIIADTVLNITVIGEVTT